MNKRMKGSLLLLATAFFWGTSFVSQSSAMDYIGPFTFQSIRFFIGGLILLPMCIKNPNGEKKMNFALLTAGLLCGAVLFAAASFQQTGIAQTGAGKTGFLTSLYIIEVPLFGLIAGKKPHPVIALSSLLALFGLYFICLSGSDGFSGGDILVLMSSVFYALHIILVGKLATGYESASLACVQFLTVAALSLPMALFAEESTLSGVSSAWFPIVYSGILSCGLGFTLQIAGQKYAEPSSAAVIMSFEAVFAMLAGIALLGERPQLREMFGSVLMLAAVTVAQLPTRRRLRKTSVQLSQK